MNNTARFEPQLLHPEQVSEQKQPEKPWLRQKNEPALWFMRFKNYLNLGPKRSLRAAFAAEPTAKKATKSLEGKKLSEVSVPGAWKRAVKVWNWKERCEAYDLHEQEIYAQCIRRQASECLYASKAYRILELNNLATLLRAQIKTGMDLKEYLAVTARLQSVMRDIALEMEELNGTTKTSIECDAAATRSAGVPRPK